MFDFFRIFKSLQIIIIFFFLNISMKNYINFIENKKSQLKKDTFENCEKNCRVGESYLEK